LINAWSAVNRAGEFGSWLIGHVTRAPALLVAAFSLSACASNFEDQVEPCTTAADLPVITADPQGIESFELSVLIYNVEGLPWPARKNRGPQLEQIGDELARLRAAGSAPDIVLLQEAFTERAQAIGERSGYRNRVAGPVARDRRTTSSANIPAAFDKARRFFKGERSGKVLGSGLLILSEFPVAATYHEPFSRHACAGFDCLSNKGVMIARLWVPGVPTPVDLFTTHMNSQEAAGVELDRAHAAHAFQTDESAAFLARVRDNRNPLIFGGDFNMRGAPDRLDHFTYKKPYHIVRHYCTVVVQDCDVRMSWDGDAPWLDTQDLQGFDDGQLVEVRPIRVEAMFDRPANGGKLSDHDGYLVRYRLSWPSGANADEEREIANARASGEAACMPVIGPGRR